MLRQTHTYAELAVSRQVHEEIAAKLRAAGYDHAFMEGGATIDMHGIGLVVDPQAGRGFKPALIKLPDADDYRACAQKIYDALAEAGMLAEQRSTLQVWERIADVLEEHFDRPERLET